MLRHLGSGDTEMLELSISTHNEYGRPLGRTASYGACVKQAVFVLYERCCNCTEIVIKDDVSFSGLFWMACQITWLLRNNRSATAIQPCSPSHQLNRNAARHPAPTQLTLRLLMSYIYIYGAPSKARNANVVYIWTYVWQRWNSLFLLDAQCFNTESMQRGLLCHICV